MGARADSCPRLLAGLLAVVWFIFACALPGNSAPAPGDKVIQVFASIEPLAFFIEKLGGPQVKVQVLLPQGQSPHTYEPLPGQIASLARAGLFFKIGLPFEQRIMEKASSLFGGLKIVDASRGISLRPAGPDHGHGEENEAADPHTWLDPHLAKIQAENVCRALAEADPGRAGLYAANLRAFQQELDSLDQRLESLLAPCRGSSFYVFHPAYDYFAEAYGLHQAAIQTGGREPSARELTRLIGSMKQEGAKVIFVQPQFSGAVVDALEKALGCRVVAIDPLARDYLQNLEKMALEIRRAGCGP